jgi:hypothetical protein
MAAGSTMRGLALTRRRRLEVDRPADSAAPARARCGSRSGRSDSAGPISTSLRGTPTTAVMRHGRPIPFEVQPQVLGHEFAGMVVETGSEVKDLRVGDRVVGRSGHQLLQPRGSAL